MSSQRSVAVILGGGAGTRLFPLTGERSKPAVPIGGKFRLIDIPISNCLNSDLYHIFILTQFNSGSLNQHISRTYSMPHFLRGVVEVLAATLTPTNPYWYQGTADAVRQNFWYIYQIAQREKAERVLILSGDHLYRMDYRQMLQFHIDRKADITVSVLPVGEEDVPGFGVLQVDDSLNIVRFVEKPKDPALIESLRVSGTFGSVRIPPERPFLASMGIYVFELSVLEKLLGIKPYNDFGKEILPEALGQYSMLAYPFEGYWRDIGTIRSYYQANLEMCDLVPGFDFFPEDSPFFTRVRSIPPAKIQGARLERSLLADGVQIEPKCKITRSILGQRLCVQQGAVLDHAILFGATRYEEKQQIPEGKPALGVGEGSVLRNCIIDKDVRIGKNVTIEGALGLPNHDDPNGLYYIREGLVILPRKAVIPDGMKIPAQ